MRMAIRQKCFSKAISMICINKPTNRHRLRSKAFLALSLTRLLFAENEGLSI
jgi:hypothetical protein